MPPTLTIPIDLDPCAHDALADLLRERGRVVVFPRAFIRHDVGDYSVDVDHVRACFEALDRLERDRGL